MQATQSLSHDVGVTAACGALQVSRATYYRRQQPTRTPSTPPTLHPRKLPDSEVQHIHDLLLSPKFVDQAPATIVANLLDEGQYLCSERTMYRILAAHGQVNERRRGHRRTTYTKPELLAKAPNQLWSWDITKLKGPAPWSYYYLYVILDVYSRYVVGWLLADRESAILAKTMIQQAYQQQHIRMDQLTLHADRGASMKSKTVGHLLADLGVTKTHSRPHTSDDNPYSEAQFKTLKYRPQFPNRFDDENQARDYCRQFFTWYNQEHKHSGIAMLTPQAVHYGQAKGVLEKRHQTRIAAFEKHPERFSAGPPKLIQLPDAVWINKPKPIEVINPIQTH